MTMYESTLDEIVGATVPLRLQTSEGEMMLTAFEKPALGCALGST